MRSSIAISPRFGECFDVQVFFLSTVITGAHICLEGLREWNRAKGLVCCILIYSPKVYLYGRGSERSVYPGLYIVSVTWPGPEARGLHVPTRLKIHKTWDQTCREWKSDIFPTSPLPGPSILVILLFYLFIFKILSTMRILDESVGILQDYPCRMYEYPKYTSRCLSGIYANSQRQR